MATKPLPSPEVLRQLLSYDPETGKLFWKERPAHFFKSDSYAERWNNRFAGREALTARHREGYCHGSLLGSHVLAHRAAMALHNGEWPEWEVDHINGDRTDNRIDNLRAVTRSENARNVSVSQRNTSGQIGVSETARGMWVAYIREGGGHVHLGVFREFEDAVSARRAAQVRFGYHRNHGRRL